MAGFGQNANHPSLAKCLAPQPDVFFCKRFGHDRGKSAFPTQPIQAVPQLNLDQPQASPAEPCRPAQEGAGWYGVGSSCNSRR
jgi:hypothetical protein